MPKTIKPKAYLIVFFLSGLVQSLIMPVVKAQWPERPISLVVMYVDPSNVRKTYFGAMLYSRNLNKIVWLKFSNSH